MARIKLVKAKTSISKRNILKLVPQILTYVNTAAIVGLILKFANII